MNRIVLTLTPGGWMATHSGPHAAEIVDLFDTDTLPTAFAAQYPEAKVLAEIQRLNPLCLVEVAA